MKSTHPAVRKYLRAVRRQLDAPREDRERLLGRLGQAVAAYVEENPEAEAEELASVFGTPEICAAELMAECDPNRIAEMRRRKRRRSIALIAALVAALVILMAVNHYWLQHAIDGSWIDGPWVTVRDHGIVTERPPLE